MATARARKREAVADLRALAAEHGLAVNRRSADLSAAAFEALAAEVAAAGGDAERIVACCHHFAGPGGQGDEAAPPGAGVDADEAAVGLRPSCRWQSSRVVLPELHLRRPLQHGSAPVRTNSA